MSNSERFPAIDNLFSWSTNYDFPTPASLFLDLIGYSEEELGNRLCNEKLPILGYLELDLIAKALLDYTEHGQDAYDHASNLANPSEQE